MLAIVALTIGAIGGGMAKWSNDDLAPMAALRRRYTALMVHLSPLVDDLPRDVTDELQDIRNAIQAGNTAQVGDTMDRIVEAVPDLDAFTHVMRDIRNQIATQKTLRPEMIQLPYWDAAFAAEALLLDDLKETPWPWRDGDAVVQAAGNAQQHVRNLTVTIRGVLASPTDANYGQLRNLLIQIATGSSPWLQGPDMTVPAHEQMPVEEPLDMPEMGNPAMPTMPRRTSTPRTNREVLLDSASFVTAVITGATIVFAGYLTQFANKAEFAGGTSAYLGLVAWAFALEVTGVTVVQIAGKISTPAPAAKPMS